jgi:hypothetical protein
MDLEAVLHSARARVLADLTAADVCDPVVVSMLEEAVSNRRWWVERWPDGSEFVTGLVAQDVQDAILERYGRWPLCPLHADDGVGEPEPHALEVAPELGADPHWVCTLLGQAVAPVGELPGRPAPDGGV